MIHAICQLLGHRPRKTVFPKHPQPCRCGRYYTYARPIEEELDWGAPGAIGRYELVTEPLKGPRTTEARPSARSPLSRLDIHPEREDEA